MSKNYQYYKRTPSRIMSIADRIAAFAVVVSLTAQAALAEAPRRIQSATMAYGFTSLADEDFQRLCAAEPLDYVLVETYFMTRQKMIDKEVSRVKALAAAGKKVILQYWWGAEDWSHYSFPHFAFDPGLLDKFMKEKIAPKLARFDPGDLYGIYLLEETGMQFGIDYVGHTDPNDPFQRDAELSKKDNPYDQQHYADWGALRGGPEIPNLLRYNDQFRQQTHLDMRHWRQWDFTDRYVFDRWCSRRVQADGQEAVLRRIKELRPDLKVYSWDFPFMEGELSRTQMADYLDVIDGYIQDPYLPVYAIFAEARLAKTLAPEKESILILMGGHAPDRVKRTRLTAAYMGGADVIGFFESPAGMDFTMPSALKQNLALHKITTSLPVFDKKSRVLLVGGHALRAGYAWMRLKYYDFISRWEMRFMDISDYDLVIIHSAGGYGTSEILWQDDSLMKRRGTHSLLDADQLERFVAKGGLLVMSGLFNIDADSDFFLSTHLTTANAPHIRPNNVNPGKREPAFWNDAVGLTGDYYFPILDLPVNVKSDAVKRDVGYYVEHKEGAVWFYPAIFTEDNPYRGPESEVFKTYTRFLTDVTGALCRHRGLDAIAEHYFPAPKQKGAFLLATSVDGKITAGVHHFAGLLPDHEDDNSREAAFTDSADVPISARDLWSGRDGIKLSHEYPAVIAADQVK